MENTHIGVAHLNTYMDNLSPHQSLALLNLKAVMLKTGLSRGLIYGKIAKGTFPKPKRPSVGRIAWIDADIDAWIASL